MTPVPLPHSSPSPQPLAHGSVAPDRTPDRNYVWVLKDLVAQLSQQQDKTQELLSSLGFALRSFTNLNQFLELIPLMASRVTNADGSALVFFQPNGQIHLEWFHCSEDYDSHHIRQTLELAFQEMTLPPVGGSLVATGGVGSLAPGLVHPGDIDDRVSHLLSFAAIQVFGAAILTKNQKIDRGRLYVFSYDPAYSWTEPRQKLVRLVADQTAVAIENDELTAELRKKERLDRELEIGAEIQRQLLPRNCPQITGVNLAARCQTASRVGGDYYDFIPIHHGQTATRSRGGNPSDCWGIAVGDVMGKGVPAGLIMTMLRGMLRAEVLNGHSPALILQHLNHIMYTDLENSNRFVTLFYSEYDPTTRLLSYSNAAHNPPLLWQRTTGLVHRLDAMGMLIGLDAHSQYEDARVQLQPGDRVIYYTDGFTDAPSQTGDRYDEEKLIQSFRQACDRCATPWEMLDFLFDQIQQFIGPNRKNEDDMTLVVLQVEEDPLV